MLVALAAFGFSAGSTYSQQSNLCTSRQAMVKALKGKYHEKRRGMGVVSNVGVMEIYVSATGTWTVVMNMTNGMSCIVAAGRDWEEMAIKPVGTST